jgi:hypothetical protein
VVAVRRMVIWSPLGRELVLSVADQTSRRTYRQDTSQSPAAHAAIDRSVNCYGFYLWEVRMAHDQAPDRFTEEELAFLRHVRFGELPPRMRPDELQILKVGVRFGVSG